MKFAATLLLIALPLSASAQSDTPSQWVLVQSTLTWHITHPVHEVDGTSHDAKGKGNCNTAGCDFLMAVPLKTFDSGDSNRDLHMMQTVRGAQFPMVIVRTHLAQ
ncbi:MAG: hypothetical protein WBE63_03800 [Acidobacteriaceae bacterium]